MFRVFIWADPICIDLIMPGINEIWKKYNIFFIFFELCFVLQRFVKKSSRVQNKSFLSADAGQAMFKTAENFPGDRTQGFCPAIGRNFEGTVASQEGDNFSGFNIGKGT